MDQVKKKKRKQIGLLALAGLLFTSQYPVIVHADSTEEIINLLKAKDIITDEEAARIMAHHNGEDGQLAGEAPSRPRKNPVTIVVPAGQQYLQTISDSVAHDIKADVTRQVKQELKDEIAKEVKLEAYTGSVPAWTKRIRFGGDIRLRYQGDYFDENNAEPFSPADPTELLNRTADRDRFRYRVRISAKAQVNSQTEVGIRLATGNEKDPISTNDTLGDYMNKDTITFDQAYLKWTPLTETSTWQGVLDFWGGRIPNPFFSTDLVWDSDLNFEGLASNLEIPFTTRLKGLVNAGVFPLQEVDFSSDDKWLYGGQLGIEYTSRANVIYTLAVGYYDYQNIQGQRNSFVSAGEGVNDFTAPLYQQLGNVVYDLNRFNSGDPLFGLASDYNELNVTGKVDINIFDPINITLIADYVKNIGFDQAEVNTLTGESVPDEDTGYSVGVTVGYPKLQKLWDWQTSLTYKYLEADAVLDAFTDSDFHLGGTNAKGWTLGGQLGLGENFWLSTRWITSDEIAGPPSTVDIFQFDINARF